MFDFGYSIFTVLFFLAFAAILAVIVTVAVRGLGEWKKNNASPRLTVDASVVSRRTSVHHHTGAAGPNGTMSAGTSSTSYYVTFQVESGDRMELHMSGPEYGMLAEGDRGRLSFQGTRYLGFARE